MKFAIQAIFLFLLIWSFGSIWICFGLTVWGIYEVDTIWFFRFSFIAVSSLFGVFVFEDERRQK